MFFITLSWAELVGSQRSPIVISFALLAYKSENFCLTAFQSKYVGFLNKRVIDKESVYLLILSQCKQPVFKKNIQWI